MPPPRTRQPHPEIVEAARSLAIGPLADAVRVEAQRLSTHGDLQGVPHSVISAALIDHLSDRQFGPLPAIARPLAVEAAEEGPRRRTVSRQQIAAFAGVSRQTLERRLELVPTGRSGSESSPRPSPLASGQATARP